MKFGIASKINRKLCVCKMTSTLSPPPIQQDKHIDSGPLSEPWSVSLSRILHRKIYSYGQSFRMGIYSLMTMQCKGKLMSRVQVHSVQPVPSILFLPKEDAKELERHQWPRLAVNAFLRASSEQSPRAAPAEKKNQDNRRTAIRATTKATRYSSSREDGSSSRAFGTDSPTVPENAGWLREDDA